MIGIVHDILSRAPDTKGIEFELRFPVPRDHFHSLRRRYIGDRDVTYTEVHMQCADSTDIRCIGRVWQRKRLVRYQQMPCAVPCRACVSVESPCSGPPDNVRFYPILKRRWSIKYGLWRVDWTKSPRHANVEIEFTGSLQDLANDSTLCAVHVPLDRVVAYLTFLICGIPKQAMPPPSKYVPFTALGDRVPVLSSHLCHRYSRLMGKAQPNSLSIPETDLSQHLASIKYDGVRMVLVVQKHRDLHLVLGLCRRKRLWHLPCSSATQNMVIDCEVMYKKKRIIVFDVYEIDGMACQGTYAERLQALEELALPVLLDYTIELKAFYPASVVNATWYNANMEGGDGIIFHDPQIRLDQRGVMYKWKPAHTIDLQVSRSGTMCCSSGTPFLPLVLGHKKKLKCGEIWECMIESGRVRPFMQRKDKLHANAPHVCHDIRAAHDASITLQKLADMVKAKRVPCKRKRDGI